MASHQILKEITAARAKAAKHQEYLPSNSPSNMTSVNRMPWVDTDGDTGIYTGEINGSKIPDGIGQMNYDDGPVVKGRWKEGEMVLDGEDDYTIEEEEDTNANNQQLPTIQQAASEEEEEVEEDVEELKKRQLQEFHERNQHFLKSQNQYNQQQQTQEDIRHYHDQQQTQEEIARQYHEQQQHQEGVHQAEVQQLHDEIYTLQDQVGELMHELQLTNHAKQHAKDNSSAEITMLRTEVEQQNSRHEHIVSSLRNRLVESEMARMKMQDQLSRRMEEDAQREEELRVQWNEMTKRVLEDKKWVDEQMNYWKESMEEHRRRLGVSKIRGELDAELEGNDEGGGDGVGGSSTSMSGPGERKRTESGDRVEDRRVSQRKLWGEGAISDSDDESEDEDDEEEMRMFGARGTSMRYLPSSIER